MIFHIYDSDFGGSIASPEILVSVDYPFPDMSSAKIKSLTFGETGCNQGIGNIGYEKTVDLTNEEIEYLRRIIFKEYFSEDDLTPCEYEDVLGARALDIIWRFEGENHFYYCDDNYQILPLKDGTYGLTVTRYSYMTTNYIYILPQELGEKLSVLFEYE